MTTRKIYLIHNRFSAVRLSSKHYLVIGENAHYLGNTRVTFRADGPDAIAIDYAADYYPYGKILREYRPCDVNRYLTTHHERDKATGYDNRGARLYDSEIGRFLGVDPLASKFQGWSTYNYVLGNPVSLVDPDGRSATGPGRGLIRKAIRGVKNLIGGVLSRLTRKTARKARKAAKDALDNFTIEAKVEQTYSVGLQSGVEVEKGLGVFGNLASLQIGKNTIGTQYTVDEGFQSTSDMKFVGLRGPTTIRSSFDASLGDGMAGAGFSIENEVDFETVDGKIEATRHVVEGDVGVTTGPVINYAAGAGVNSTTDKGFLKTSVGAGVQGGYFFGVKFEAKVELRYNFD